MAGKLGVFIVVEYLQYTVTVDITLQYDVMVKSFR